MLIEVMENLRRNVRETKFGTVGVKLKVHNGKIVQTLYEVTKTSIGKKEEEDERDSGNQ